MPSYRLFRKIAIAAIFASPVAAAAQNPVVSIDLKNFSFAPSPIHLRAGQEVTLTFTNRADGGHDFTAKEFFRAAKVISGNVTEGEVELGAGQSKSVTLVPSAGRYKVHCGHAFHTMFGMTSEIIVD